MGKSVTPGRTRIELELPSEIVDAARAAVGDRGVSRLVGELLAKKLKVPYQAPRLGRPRKEASESA